MNERPDWKRFDTIKSIIDLGKLALDTIMEKIDTHHANALNEDE